MIHCCDKCVRPILIYGRMIPCKHVFCLACAKMEERACPRCGDKVSRVEQAGLGNIFLCTQGGSRYGNTGCRRTYLSSRYGLTSQHSMGTALVKKPTSILTNSVIMGDHLSRRCHEGHRCTCLGAERLGD